MKNKNYKIIGKFLIAMFLVVCFVLTSIYAFFNFTKKGVYAAESPISAGGVNVFDQTAYDSGIGKFNLKTNTFSTSAGLLQGNSKTTNRAVYWVNDSTSTTVSVPSKGDPKSTEMSYFEKSNFISSSGVDSSKNISTGYGSFSTEVIQTTLDSSAKYSVTFSESGNYSIYVYSDKKDADGKYSEPSINGYFVNSGARFNALSSTENHLILDGEIGSGWWKFTFNVDKIKWNVQQIVCNTTGDGGRFTPYNNDVSVNTRVSMDCIMVFTFSKDTALGPICKQGNTITVNNDDTKGTLMLKNIFGETIGTTNSDDVNSEYIWNCEYGKILIEVMPKEGFFFKEFTGVNTYNLNDSIVYELKTNTSILNSVWTDSVDKLGNISVYDGETLIDETVLNVSGNKPVSIDSVEYEQKEYKLIFNCELDTNIEKISYKIVQNGTNTVVKTDDLKASNGLSIDVSVYWATDVYLTFTSQSGNSYTVTYNFNKLVVGKDCVAQIGSKVYYYIEDALMEANAGDDIEIISDVSFVTENEGEEGKKIKPEWLVNNQGYVLKSDVDLLLVGSVTGSSSDHPYAIRALASGGTSQMNPDDKYLEHVLTIPKGINLDVYGTVVIAGTISGEMANADNSGFFKCGGGANVGSHCKIQLEGTIYVKANGILSIYGYVSGNGRIIGEVNSSIYQPLAIVDFKGGSYTVSAAGKVSILNLALSHKSGENIISPFSQYFFYGVQCNLTMYEGAYQYAYCALSADGEYHCTTACVVGGPEKAGLITLEEGAEYNSRYEKDVTAYHLPYVGKTTISIKGGASLGSMDLAINYIATVTIKTSNLIFPIPYNYHVELLEGNFNINYGIKLLPGAKIFVGEEAILNFNGSQIVAIYDGLVDHVLTSGPSVTAGVRSKLGYPSASQLNNSGNGYNGTANLVVEGTVNLGSSVKFGGVIQAQGENALVNAKSVSSQSNLSVKTQEGLVGNSTLGKEYAGATVRQLTAQVMDATTGKRTNIVAGKEYYSHTNSSVLENYTYTVYTNKDGTSQLMENVALNENLSGSWYNYTVEVNYVVNGVVTGDTEIMYFCHGADVTDMLLYSDVTCQTKINTITSNQTLYVCCDVHDFVIGKDGEIYCSNPNCKVLSGTVAYNTTENNTGVASCKLYFFGDVKVKYFVVITAGNNRYLVENTTLTQKTNYTELTFDVFFAANESFETKLPVGATIEVYEDTAFTVVDGEKTPNNIKLRGYQYSGTSIRFYSTLLHSFCGDKTTAEGSDKVLLSNLDKIEVYMKMEFIYNGEEQNPTSGKITQNSVYNYLYQDSSSIFAFEDSYVFSVKTSLESFASRGVTEVVLTLVETVYTNDGNDYTYSYPVTITFENGVISTVEAGVPGETGEVVTNQTENA